MTRWYDSLQLMWHDGVSAERRDAGAGRAGSRLHHPRHVHQHLVNIFLLISDIYPLQHCLLCLTWFLTFWFFDILKSRYLLWYLILFPRWYEPSSLALCSWKIQEVDNSNINTHKYICMCVFINVLRCWRWKKEASLTKYSIIFPLRIIKFFETSVELFYAINGSPLAA